MTASGQSGLDNLDRVKLLGPDENSKMKSPSGFHSYSVDRSISSWVDDDQRET